ncbi:DUF1566 domain-containing protein [bacterium]|nr:DUF1566 domain-containing protein [bacterium]
MKKHFTVLTRFICAICFFIIIPNLTWAADYTDNGNGTISDNITSLMWQKEDTDSTYTWEAALTYCEGLTLGSQSDWRLPNIRELESIVDETVYNPSINSTYFPNTNSWEYWSSTTHADTLVAWGVNFVNGSVDDYENAYVRCVRGGQ